MSDSSKQDEKPREVAASSAQRSTRHVEALSDRMRKSVSEEARRSRWLIRPVWTTRKDED